MPASFRKQAFVAEEDARTVVGRHFRGQGASEDKTMATDLTPKVDLRQVSDAGPVADSMPVSDKRGLHNSVAAKNDAAKVSTTKASCLTDDAGQTGGSCESGPAAHIPQLFIRALNNDNHHDATRLSDLFRHHYADNHPFRNVYDPNFWVHSRRSKIEPGGLISLVAEEDGKFIAHLGLDHNPLTNAVQVMLPAIHPRYKTAVFSIIRQFWAHIERHAARQQWSVVFGYNLSVQPLLQLLSAKCYHCEATALMPCSRVSYGFDRKETIADPNSTMLVMCNVLHPGQSESTVLHPPGAHARKVRALYDAIGLRRTFHDVEASSTFREAVHTGQKWEQRKGFFARHLKRFGLFQLRVMPSAVSDQNATHALIDRIESQRTEKRHRLSIQVALDDPRCPEFSQELERRGYRFCGVLPLIALHDYIVFAKFDDSEIRRLTLYTEASKALRDYMLNSTRMN
ncbi:MAG: hypothetical protein KDD69_18785 [Bdellovibrionales bacterium]|nr:hypothetical protein [Bdellovibrionales bacterium]